jgi:excisionase family DNA binding protein
MAHHAPSQVAYSPAQVAALLGWSEPTVRGKIARGTIKAQRWGRRVLIPKHELDAQLRAVGLLPAPSARQSDQS